MHKTTLAGTPFYKDTGPPSGPYCKMRILRRHTVGHTHAMDARGLHAPLLQSGLTYKQAGKSIMMQCILAMPNLKIRISRHAPTFGLLACTKGDPKPCPYTANTSLKMLTQPYASPHSIFFETGSISMNQLFLKVSKWQKQNHSVTPVHYLPTSRLHAPAFDRDHNLTIVYTPATKVHDGASSP